MSTVEWQSPKGARRVEHASDGLCYVRTEGASYCVVLPEAELAEEIERDTRNVRSALRGAEQPPKPVPAPWDAFLLTLPARNRPRAAAVLAKCVRNDGRLVSRGDLVTEWHRKGARVGHNHKFGHILTLPSGAFLTSADITATAISFARFLVAGVAS